MRKFEYSCTWNAKFRPPTRGHREIRIDNREKDYRVHCTMYVFLEGYSCHDGIEQLECALLYKLRHKTIKNHSSLKLFSL